MGKVIRAVKTATNAAIFNRTRQVVRAIEEVTQMKAAAVSSGLVINGRKTK
jgi:hypothetical protein